MGFESGSSQDGVSSPTSESLKRLERTWSGGNNGSVQQWVDSLSEAGFVSSLVEERPSDNDNDNAISKGVSFLQLPGSNDEDELILGAEAKSLSESNSLGFSPRLSPLVISDSEPSYPVCKADLDTDAITATRTETKELDDNDNENVFCTAKRDLSDSLNSNDVECSKAKSSSAEQTASTKSGSATSLQDIPSLLAAMEMNPEDALISLGFGQQSFLSPIYRIPERFLKHPSEAKGIHTQKFYLDALQSEGQDSQSIFDNQSKRWLLSRFNQSSIDLPDVDDSSLTRKRRSRMHDVIPAITIDIEDGTPSDKNSPSRGSGNWRLSTVIEEYEPGSRRSSFSRCTPRSPLQRQAKIDIAPDGSQPVISFEHTDLDLDASELNCFSPENTDAMLQRTAERLEALVNHSGVDHVRKPGSGAFNSTDIEPKDSRSHNSGLSIDSVNCDVNDNVNTECLLYERRKKANSELMVYPTGLKVVIPTIVVCADGEEHSSGFIEDRPVNCKVKNDDLVDEIIDGNIFDDTSSKDSMKHGAKRRDYLDDHTDESLSLANHLESTNVATTAAVVEEDMVIAGVRGTSQENQQMEEFACYCDRPESNEQRMQEDVDSEVKGDVIEMKKLDENGLVQQYSVDSLEENNEESCGNKNAGDEQQCGEVIDEDHKNSKAMRIVFRTREKAENREVLEEKEDSTNEDLINDGKKRRSWTKRLLESLELKKSENVKCKTVLKEEKVDNDDNDERRSSPATVSALRDYFRKLTTRRFNPSRSMNDISDVKYNNNSISETKRTDGFTQSAIDLSEGIRCFDAEGIDKVKKHIDASSKDNEDKTMKKATWSISQSAHDLRRTGLESTSFRRTAFIDIGKIKHLLRTGHRAPERPQIQEEADDTNVGRGCQGESARLSRDSSISAGDYRRFQQLGNARNGDDEVLVECSRAAARNDAENAAYIAGKIAVKGSTQCHQPGASDDHKFEEDSCRNSEYCRTRTGVNLAMKTMEEKEREFDEDHVMKKFSGRPSSPEVAVDRFITSHACDKRYSIESSGFEDEADHAAVVAGTISPDRGNSGWHESGRRQQLCSHCIHSRIEKPILEKSLSANSVASHEPVSRDSLEQRSLSRVDDDDFRDDEQEAVMDELELKVDDLMNIEQLRCSTRAEIDRTWAKNNRFDYLVNQITSLRQELREQRETYESFIDDRIERMKTSILTEISILNASQKISSPNHSYRLHYEELYLVFERFLEIRSPLCQWRLGKLMDHQVEYVYVIIPFLHSSSTAVVNRPSGRRVNNLKRPAFTKNTPTMNI
eukprot:gene17680-19444_t